MPVLSVITGAYNVASCPHFDKSIRSVLEQTLTDFEFIICDDGSSDETYALLSEYAKADPRIKLIKNEKNLGLAAALNNCISHAEGKYLARHDCDDYNDPKRFEKQIAYLEANPDVSVLGTAAYLFDESGVWGKDTMPRVVKNEDFLFTSPYKHGSVIFRREPLLDMGGYSTSQSVLRNEDYDLFMRMQTKYKGENLEEPLYYFCEDESAKRRRKYRYRINEYRVRKRGFKALGLMPKALPYVVKPLIVGLVPGFILARLQAKRRNKQENGT